MNPSEIFTKFARGAPFGTLGILSSFLLPEIDGGFHVGSRTTAAGLNKPRWAKITDAAGSAPVRYAWEEQTFQPLAPGGNTSIGFAKADAGIIATVLQNPIIEPNRKTLQIGDYCLVQREFFDPTLDWVFSVVGSTGASGGMAFAQCLNATPSSGRFDALLRNVNADGSLDTAGTSIWLRDGNNRSRLVLNKVYMCALTGNTAGRPVYTTVDDSIDIVDLNSDGAGTPATYGDVWELRFDSTPTAWNGVEDQDFVFSWDATNHVLTARLNGRTADDDWIEKCESGQLVKWTQVVRNGLVKNKTNRDPPT